jgi:hypothetical protein
MFFEIFDKYFEKEVIDQNILLKLHPNEKLKLVVAKIKAEYFIKQDNL